MAKNNLENKVLTLHQLPEITLTYDSPGHDADFNKLIIPNENNNNIISGARLPTGYKEKGSPTFKQSRPLLIHYGDNEIKDVQRERANNLDLFEEVGSFSSADLGILVDSRPDEESIEFDDGNKSIIQFGIYVAETEGKYVIKTNKFERNTFRSAILGLIPKKQLNTSVTNRIFVLGISGGEDLKKNVFRTPWKEIGSKLTPTDYLESMRTETNKKAVVNALFYSAKDLNEVVKIDFDNKIKEYIETLSQRII